MPLRKSANTGSLISAHPQIQVAIDQLSQTRSQDWARVFLPGADQEMAKSSANILTQQAAVQGEMDKLKTTLEGIYQKDVKPNI
jgi:sn-glycerol 3-phosphate transport system substrate-binding protein